jgi:hypothetical protein
MQTFWIFETRWGTFAIKPVRDRYHAMFGDESLGSYGSPELALDDLVGGHTFSLPKRLDSSKTGMPDDLSEWTIVQH